MRLSPSRRERILLGWEKRQWEALIFAYRMAKCKGQHSPIMAIASGMSLSKVKAARHSFPTDVAVNREKFVADAASVRYRRKLRSRLSQHFGVLSARARFTLPPHDLAILIVRSCLPQPGSNEDTITDRKRWLRALGALMLLSSWEFLATLALGDSKWRVRVWLSGKNPCKSLGLGWEPFE